MYCYLRFRCALALEAPAAVSRPGQHDAAIHDVAGKLGWSLVEGRRDGVDDGLYRLLESDPHVFG